MVNTFTTTCYGRSKYMEKVKVTRWQRSIKWLYLAEMAVKRIVLQYKKCLEVITLEYE